VNRKIFDGNRFTHLHASGHSWRIWVPSTKLRRPEPIASMSLPCEINKPVSSPKTNAQVDHRIAGSAANSLPYPAPLNKVGINDHVIDSAKPPGNFHFPLIRLQSYYPGKSYCLSWAAGRSTGDNKMLILITFSRKWWKAVPPNRGGVSIDLRL